MPGDGHLSRLEWERRYESPATQLFKGFLISNLKTCRETSPTQSVMFDPTTEFYSPLQSEQFSEVPFMRMVRKCVEFNLESGWIRPPKPFCGPKWLWNQIDLPAHQSASAGHPWGIEIISDMLNNPPVPWLIMDYVSKVYEIWFGHWFHLVPVTGIFVYFPQCIQRANSNV